MKAKTTDKLAHCLYKILRPLGVSYVASFILRYPEKYKTSRFCGNLLNIRSKYKDANEHTREKLTKQFEDIIDSLVLPNGVRKTTFSGRHSSPLLSLCKNRHKYLPIEAIKILEIPSSIGTASIGNYRILAENFSISSYTMADQYFKIIFDRDRGCIFDDAGNLLQTQFTNYFFSIYRPHSSGNAYGILARLMLFPFDIISSRLKHKYRLSDSTSTAKLMLLHPEAEEMVKQGLMSCEKMDIFQPIYGLYDLILSFNLLQKNYFSAGQIKTGTENLANALKDGGVLIMGSTESYKIQKKVSDQLIDLESVGDF